jgi:riboflavin kinase/FMN adenylyltransferase
MMKFSGIVEKGAGQASLLAVPTANLPLSSDTPKPGIYACLIELENEHYKGIAYIGKAWLVKGAPERIEFHLFDYEGPAFYGKSIAVELKAFLRQPVEFTSEEQANTQIITDIKAAKAFFLNE